MTALISGGRDGGSGHQWSQCWRLLSFIFRQPCLCLHSMHRFSIEGWWRRSMSGCSALSRSHIWNKVFSSLIIVSIRTNASNSLFQRLIHVWHWVHLHWQPWRKHKSSSDLEIVEKCERCRCSNFHGRTCARVPGHCIRKHQSASERIQKTIRTTNGRARDPNTSTQFFLIYNLSHIVSKDDCKQTVQRKRCVDDAEACRRVGVSSSPYQVQRKPWEDVQPFPYFTQTFDRDSVSRGRMQSGHVSGETHSTPPSLWEDPNQTPLLR